MSQAITRNAKLYTGAHKSGKHIQLSDQQQNNVYSSMWLAKSTLDEVS